MRGLSSPVALETDDRGFWEPKGYLSVSRRTSNGYALCDQFRQMVEELESAITSYTKSLDNWSMTWKSKIAKNGECGSSLTRAVFHLIEATEALKASQAGVAADLRANVVGQMKKWQKGNYRRNLVGKVKEATDIEAGFDASQTPWIKLLKKLHKAKQRYYDLSKKIINMKHQESIARHDTSKAPDDLEEMRIKIGKLESEEVDAKTAYRDALNQLESYQQKYRENMAFHNEKADALEIRRLSFAQSLVGNSRQAFTKLVSGTEHDKLTEAIRTLEASASSIRAEEDVAAFRRRHGADMPFQLPEYEEYTEILHQLLRGQKLSKKLSSNHVGGGVKSLGSMIPFKSPSSSILPTTPAAGDDTDAPTGQITMLRVVSRQSPICLQSPSLIDANNNSGKFEYEVGQEAKEGDGKQQNAVTFEAVVEELTERQRNDKAQEDVKSKQVVSVSPSVRRTDESLAREVDGSSSRNTVVGSATEPSAQSSIQPEVCPPRSPRDSIPVAVASVASVDEITVRSGGASVAPSPTPRPHLKPRPPNLKVVTPSRRATPAGRATPSRRAERCSARQSSATEAPLLTLTQPTPEREDDDGSVFEDSPSLSPYLKEEDKNASVTDPRLLSRGGDDDGAAVEPPNPNSEADAGGDVTTDDVTLEEPEMTLARGGSTLGGDISSFDENLTLPDEGDGCCTPIQMSTDVKKKKNPRIEDEREAGMKTPSRFSIEASPRDDFGDSTEGIKEPGEEGKKGDREANNAGKKGEGESDDDEEEKKTKEMGYEMGEEMTKAVEKRVSGASDASVTVASKASTEDVAATKPFPRNEWTDKFRNVLTEIVSKPPEEN